MARTAGFAGRWLAAVFVAILAAAAAFAQTDRILIVGDSWANSIATAGRAKEPGDTPGFGTMQEVLDANGLDRFTSRGEKTAWGGRRAEQWARPENLAVITGELDANPSIDIVVLCIGGNDFLSLARDVAFPYLDAKSRDMLWSAVQDKVQTIVDSCLAARPDMHVLIYGYDYLDIKSMETAYGFDFHGIDQRAFNTAMVELGRKKLAIAQRTDRCEYVQNWGALQHHFHAPDGFPEPGSAPDYVPFPGGDIASTMPAAAHVGDGVHPNDAGHRVLLQRAFDQYLRRWLLGEERADAR